MSSYASQPAPSNPTHNPSANQPLNANVWSATSLDHLTFPPNQNPTSSMGGLRRPSPQPQSVDPSLSIVDAATASLSNLQDDRLANDRFLLDSARLDFDTPLQTRPTPNHVEQPQPHTHHHPQKQIRSQNPHAFQHQWEPPTGANRANFSPEAFEVTDELGITTSAPPESYAARRKHAKPLGVGKYVQRIMNFNRRRQQGMHEPTYENDMKRLIAVYFMPGTTVHIDLKRANSDDPLMIKVPVELLPRVWKTKLEAGLRDERMLLEDPCEFQYPNGTIAVDCPTALITSTYTDRTIFTVGHLRVTFTGEKRMAEWQLNIRNHTEFFNRQNIRMGHNLASHHELGLPPSVVRVLFIATDIHQLKDRMNKEVEALCSNPQRWRNLQGLLHATANKQEVALSNRPVSSTVQNGNAFKALTSVLDGTQLDHSQGPNLGTPRQRSGRGADGSSLPGDLNIDMKGELHSDANIPPNLREAINSLEWDEQQQAMMLPHLSQEAIRQSCMGGNVQNIGSSGGHNPGDPILNGRKAVPTAADGSASQARQSAHDAVTAAASGHGGWGMSAPNGNGMGGNLGTGEDMERLQLLSAATQGNFSGQHDGAATQHTNIHGQNAPPGLKIFNPQTNQGGQESEQQPRRGRGSGRGRGTGSVGNLHSRQSRRRGGGSNAKKETMLDSRHNASRRGNHGDFVGTSQGLTDQSSGVGNITNSLRTSGKGQKERQVGNRRAAQRNSSGDERGEKRQKSSANG